MKITNKPFPFKKYLKLKRQWLKIGPILNGSLNQVKNKCGKPNCACHDNPKALHGPYWLWTTKWNGKSVAKFVKPKQAKLCVKWVENYKKAENLLTQMIQIAYLYEPWKEKTNGKAKSKTKNSRIRRGKGIRKN